MTMQWIDRRRLGKELLAGMFLNLGSATACEIVADTGFDWLLLDMEHGSGTLADLRSLLNACRGSTTAPFVRIPSVDPDVVKFVMDSGAAGVMFPYVSTVEAARHAVQCMKYPPQGTRGVAGAIRATDYGRNWQSYFEDANHHSCVVVQIETREAVDAADQIAAVDGVDVLFVGPLDLSVNLGCAGDFSQTHFVEALQVVVDACRRHRKTPGILTKPGFEAQHLQMGFQFVALGSDALAVTAAARQNLNTLTSTPNT